MLVKDSMKQDRCRKCNHVRLIHLRDEDGAMCNRGWLMKGDDDDEYVDHCSCDGYVPLDNLEYLEWKYEQSLGQQLKKMLKKFQLY